MNCLLTVAVAGNFVQISRRTSIGCFSLSEIGIQMTRISIVSPPLDVLTWFFSWVMWVFWVGCLPSAHWFARFEIVMAVAVHMIIIHHIAVILGLHSRTIYRSKREIEHINWELFYFWTQNSFSNFLNCVVFETCWKLL